MKKIITLISLCCSVILAQNEQIEMTYYLEAKPDKVKQLEKGLKDHTDKFHQSAEHLVHTWEVVAGERTGQYMRNGPTQNWADFDVNVDHPGDAVHWERSVAPYVKDMSGRVYWRYLPKLSYSKATHLAKMFAIWYPRYKPGQWRQHRDALEKVREALEDNDSNARMFVYSKVVGGQGRMYAICFGMDSWEDMWPDKTNLWDKLEKTFGEGKGTEILNARSSAVEDYHSEVLLFRPELSTPVSK